MKNDIIRFENNVPDNYLVGSRDYQALLRLFTFGISSIKFDVDNIRYVNDASHINSRLLNLLKLKVGFFTKEEFKDQYIREVLKVFSLIVKKKGTRQAIYDAINLYFRACRYNGDYVVEINNKDAIQPYMVRIGVTKESNDILLLEEILKYILPTGYLYEVFKYSTAKYKSNYYTQDQLTLSVIDDYNGSNIHSNSSNVFIEKLYEGTSVGPASIITITDGAENERLLSAVVNIEPVQDLNGYDYPWPGGGGVNMAHLADGSRTGQGCTGTVASEVISVSGTASATYVNATWMNNITIVSGESYTVRLSKALTVDITFRFATDTTDTTYQQVRVNAGYTSAVFTANNNFAKYRIYVSGITSGTAINISDLQILVGKGTVGSFSPYSNISPISGWTQVNVWQTGGNLLNYDAWKSVPIIHGTGVFENNGVTLTATANDCYTSFTSSGGYPSAAQIPVKVGQPITLSWDTPDTAVAAQVYIFPNGSATGLVSTPAVNKKLTYTPTAGITYVAFRLGVTSNGATIHYKNLMVNFGTAAAAYTPLTDKRAIAIALGQTVYGGTLDVLRGKLTVTDMLISDISGLYANGTSSTGAYRYRLDVTEVAGYSTKSAISSALRYNAAFNGSANSFYNNTGYLIIFLNESTVAAAKQFLTNNSVTFVCPLITPQEYDVTPQTIKTLLGVNNIWADAGEMSIEYLSEASGGSYITYYNVYNNVTDNYINILTYPSVDGIELYNGDFTVSISEADFDLDNANMYVLIHQYLKDDRIVCSNTTWSISYDAQTDSITATSGNNEINISYSNFIRNLPLLEDHEIPSSFTLEYENESISTEGFVLQDDNRSFTFTGYSGNKIIVKYETDSQYLGKRIDNVVVYKNGWENESD